jgi:membrane fusion protein, heavy metal efflux system
MIHSFNIKKIFFFGYFISGLAMWSSCKDNKSAETATNTEPTSEHQVILNAAQLKNISLSTANLEKKTLTHKIMVNGKTMVPHENEIAISVPYGGYVKSAKYMEGMKVSKGQVLTTIENEQFITLQEDYLNNQAKLSLSNSELARQTELNKDKSSSDKILQQAQHENTMLKIGQKAIAEKLSLIGINPSKLTSSSITRSINVYAPASGYISVVNIKRGQYVNPSDVLFEIIDPSNQMLALNVFEKDLPYIAVGQKVDAQFNTTDGTTLTGKVKYIGQKVSNQNYTEVLCDLNKKIDGISGRYINGTIHANGHEMWCLPQEAIVDFEGAKYVFVVSNPNVYDMVKVMTGSNEDDFIAIEDFTILQNKTIVTKGAYALLMKLKNKEE